MQRRDFGERIAQLMVAQFESLVFVVELLSQGLNLSVERALDFTEGAMAML